MVETEFKAMCHLKLVQMVPGLNEQNLKITKIIPSPDSTDAFSTLQLQLIHGPF